MSDYGVLDEALAAFTVYKVGESADGTEFQSYDSLTPVDDTVVFPADDPTDEMTVVEAEAKYGTIYWLMEPEALGTAVTAAAGGAPDLPPVIDPADAGFATPVDPAAPDAAPQDAALPPQGDLPPADLPPEPNEADRAEQEAVLEDAETRVAQLEGMVTELMLRTVTDDVFLADHGADSIVEQNRPKVAALLSTIVSGFGDVTPIAVRLAAMASQSTTDDITERLDQLIERLQKLEETVTELMDKNVEDDEMPEEPEEPDEEKSASESPSTVDEGKRQKK
ncbi:MAG: hypothetical protein ACOYOQ_00165 [Microthrixaceae bacterium]